LRRTRSPSSLALSPRSLAPSESLSASIGMQSRRSPFLCYRLGSCCPPWLFLFDCIEFNCVGFDCVGLIARLM
jgi:hypothetical protein